MDDFKLTTKQILQLREAHRHAADKRQADRIKTVILLGSGWSVGDVAEVLLLDPDTLRRHVERYRNGGVDHLLAMHYRGSRPKLNDEQQSQLDAHLSARIYLSSAEIIVYIEQTFDIRYSVSGLTDLLHRLGYTYKKPKLVGGKADAEAQRQFVDQYEKLKKNKGKNDPIYFMDAVHPQHNTATGYGWIKRGEDKFIKSNTGRQRLNINGAINIDSMQAVTRCDDTINAQSSIELFKQIERKHRKANVIYIICDNARYYRSKLVGVFLETARIKLVFLPPYAPNLNLIERLWKYFRKQVTCNRYYERFDDFKQACITFFKTIPRHKQALRQLLTENFHILSAAET